MLILILHMKRTLQKNIGRLILSFMGLENEEIKKKEKKKSEHAILKVPKKHEGSSLMSFFYHYLKLPNISQHIFRK